MKNNQSKLISVITFTFIQGLKSTWFWGMLILGILSLLLGMNYDKIMKIFEEKDAVIISVIDKSNEQYYLSYFEQEMHDVNEYFKYEVVNISSEQEIIKDIQDNTSKYGACIIFSENGYTARVVYGDNIESNQVSLHATTVADLCIRLYLASSIGISKNDVEILFGNEYVSEEYISNDQTAEGFLLIVFFLMTLYLLILLYGGILANSVVEEKGNRIMETLICYSDPMQLMFGKIVGFLLLAITHIVVWCISAFFMTKTLLEKNSGTVLINELFSAQTVALFVICLIFGFLFYAIAYIACASFADNAQDSTQLMFPMTFILIIAFIVSLMSMRHMGGSIATILSFCPFFAPIVLFGNVIYHHMENYLLIVSIITQLVEIIVLARIGSLFYRRGVLHYGRVDLFRKRRRNE